ncbi:MAG: hypothetical protein ACLQSR_07075 [Limisphaerales bacterium]
MRHFQLLLAAGGCAFIFATQAQEILVSTNVPPTKIQNFELQTDTVLIKGYQETGTINTDGGVVSVRCKASTEATTAHTEYGIAVGLTVNNEYGSLIVDYDELNALLNGLAFLNRINYSVTPLQSFDAVITTKSGLRVGAHSERRQGGILLFIQFGDSQRIELNSDQFSQLQNLITQAKATLDGIIGKNSTP